MKKILKWFTKTKRRKILASTLAIVTLTISLRFLFFSPDEVYASTMHWSFSEGYGITTNDSSGNSNSGTITNALWKTDDLCRNNKCLYFDGSGDYVSRSDDADLDFIAADDFTITGWFRHSIIATNPDYLVVKHQSATAGGYKVYMDSDGDIAFGIDDDGTWGPEDVVGDDQSLNLDDNKWHHFAAVKDGTTGIYIYIDGQLKDSDTSLTASGTLANAASFYIGIDSDGSSNGWDGFIDEIKVHREMRSASQILTDYNSGAPEDGASASFTNDQSYLSNGLVGYWKLDETSGNAVDYSGNSNTLTDTNTVAFVGGKFGNAGDFESGNSEYQYIADNANLSITGSLTLSAWIRPESVSAGSYNIISKWDGSNESFRLFQNGDEIRLELDTAGNYQETSSYNLSASTWYHVAGVYDSITQTAKIFINGSEVSSTTTGTIPSSIGDDAGRLQIGTEDSTTTAANFYDGYIDEARIYNRVFSNSEIAKLYKWATGPLANWKFDEGTGYNLYDSSGSLLNFAGPLSSPSALANGSNNTTAGQTITTSSISPTVGKKLLIFVIAQKNNHTNSYAWSITASAGDTPSSVSTTSEYSWAENTSYTSQGQLYELDVASSGSRTFTIDAKTSSTATYYYSYIILEVDDTAYAQSVVANGGVIGSGGTGSSSGTGTISLASAPTNGNLVIAFAAKANDTSGAITAPTDFTAPVNQTQTFTSAAAFYRTDTTSLTVSYTDLGQDVGNWVGFLLELGDSSRSFRWTDGKFGKGVSINGTSNYISRQYDNEFDFGTGEFTLSSWFKANSGVAQVNNTFGIKNYTGFEGGDETPANGDGGIDTYSWTSANDSDVEYVNVQGTTKRTGDYALEKIAGDSTEDEWVAIASPNNSTLGLTETVWTTFYIRPATQPTTNQDIAQINKGTFNAGIISIQWVANTWNLRLNNVGAQSSTVTLTQNTWHKLELKYDYTNSTVTMYLDDGTGVSLAAVNTWASFTYGEFYIGTNDLGSGVFYVDDLVISTSELDFSPQVHRMDPDGNGNSTAWTNDYTTVDEIPADDDTTYISSSTATNQELVTLESASSAGITNSIRAVKTQALIRDEGGASNIATVIRSGGTDYDQGEDVDPGSSYKSIGTVKETNPRDSLSWDAVDLDSLEVGVLNNASVASRATVLSNMVLTDNITPGASTTYIISRYDSDQGFKIWIDTNDLLNFGIDDDSTWSPDDTATSTLGYRDDTWHYFSAIKTTSAIYLYVDGLLVGSDTSLTATGTLTSDSAPFTIGSDEPTNDDYFYGMIDDLKVYNYARNIQQIIEDMNAGHPAPGSPIGSAIVNWRFEYYTAGTCGKDSSPNANDLSCNSFTSAGKIGSAFQGADATRGTLTDDSDVDFAADEGFTIGAWFNRSTISNTEYILSKIASTAGYALYMNSTGQVVFGIGDQSSGAFPEDTASSTNEYDDSTWHHVIGVKDGTTSIKLYIDGVLVATNSALGVTGTLSNVGDLYVGDGNNTNGTDEFLGKIDEVQIYRSAFTIDQIKIFFNQSSGVVFGATSTDASGNPDNSASRSYCVPGDTTSCDAPVAHYKLDENSTAQRLESSSMTSSSQQGNQLVLGAATTAGTDDPAFIPGVYGSGLDFDGSADYAETADDADLDFADTDNFTIEAWFNRDGLYTSDDVIVSKRANYTANRPGYVVWIDDATDDINIEVSDGGGAAGDEFSLNGTTSFTSAGWHHVAIVIYKSTDDNTSSTIYVDGIPDKESSSGDLATVGSLESTAAFDIGKIATQDYFDGKIDDVRVYRYIRTPAQIEWDYNRGKSIGWWKFDECSGTTANDASIDAGGNTKNGDGTITPGASTHTSVGSCNSGSASEMWDDGQTGKRNYSLDFDGGDDYVDMNDVAAYDFADSRNFTIAGWFNRETYTTDDTIVSKKNDQLNSSAGYNVWIDDSTDDLRFVISDGDSANIHTIDSTSAFTTTGWNHFVIVYDDSGSSSSKIYINGRDDSATNTTTGTFSSIGDVSNAVDFRIGSEADGGEPFAGELDDIQIYNYALTANQTKTLFNQGAVNFSPSEGTP